MVSGYVQTAQSSGVGVRERLKERRRGTFGRGLRQGSGRQTSRARDKGVPGNYITQLSKQRGRILNGKVASRHRNVSLPVI